MWSPPPDPPARAAMVLTGQQRAARRRRLWDEINSIRVPMAANLRVLPGTNGGAVAQADGQGNIYVGGRVSDQVMAHEAAHNLQLTAGDQRRFSRIMGVPNKPWEVVEASPSGQMMAGHSSVEERFADMVSMLATRKFPKPGQGGGYPYLDELPSRREILRFGRALERYGKRNGLARYVRPQ